MKTKIITLILVLSLVLTNVLPVLAITNTYMNLTNLDISYTSNEQTNYYRCEELTGRCIVTYTWKDDDLTYDSFSACNSNCNIKTSTSFNTNNHVYTPTTTKPITYTYTVNNNFSLKTTTTTMPVVFFYTNNSNITNDYVYYTGTTTKPNNYVKNINTNDYVYYTPTTTKPNTYVTGFNQVTNYVLQPTTTTKPINSVISFNPINDYVYYTPTTTIPNTYVTGFNQVTNYVLQPTTTTIPNTYVNLPRAIDLAKAVTVTTLPLTMFQGEFVDYSLEDIENKEEIQSIDTSIKREIPVTKALIVVKSEGEKGIYTELIQHEQNFDFKIDIISLAENRISSNPKSLKKYLWSLKDQYDYFVLDERIPYGEINEGQFKTDYFYAHDDRFFEYNKSGAAYFESTTERYPELIISRMNRDQIQYYIGTKKRFDNINALFALPFLFFNWEQYQCGVGTYPIDLSYTGDFFKNKFSKINPNMSFLTMYDDKSDMPDARYLLKSRQRKQPDMTLNAENFNVYEGLKNFFLMYNTYEPMNEEGTAGSIYTNSLTSALWKDKNNDNFAKPNEITKIDIKRFTDMNQSKNFSFYFVPLFYKVGQISAPLVITQPFSMWEESNPSQQLGFFIGNDPQNSSVSTAWNAILTDIISGKTFAESTLLGYTNYFKVLQEKDDPNSAALQATRLTFFGLSWYTINDMIKQAEIQITDTYFKSNTTEVKIPVKNTGDEVLRVRVLDNPNINTVGEILIQPEETKYISITKKQTNLFDDTSSLPKKSFATITLQTNSKKHPSIQILLEFWE
jgi:hypothetical protein